ncbi:MULTISPECIES: DUF6292 family protein [Streptosporangium]|uniref:DUF6292 domain-containing protein n=1 Tax=Streptosporangium brasiliense TaxID=47480 RepID=A0ABT9RGS6_9ACTN|nr:DUF6292 family protein [Streptosporangium brasiliense]MDP9868479.1 hypothetical protein [Streptosporangium brasiliense]
MHPVGAVAAEPGGLDGVFGGGAGAVYIGAVAQALTAAGLPPLSGWCTPDENTGFLAWNAGHTAPAHWPQGLALCWHHEHGWSWADQEAEIPRGRLSELAIDAAPADVARVAARLLAAQRTQVTVS